MSNTQPTNVEADAIRLRGVSKHYRTVRAVDGVHLSVRRGEVFGLIGHNGAGKSTLFKMMLGLIVPTAGEIQIGGAAVSGRGFRAVRRHMGYLPENVVLYDNLSGLETLRFFARLKSVPAQECEAALERVGLAHAGERPVREYSKGMRQRLGFAQALLGKPQVLFLDEPTTGLDPLAIRDFYATLRGLRDEGVTMILTSHILAELQDRVDRLAILSAGRVLAMGSVQSLREQVAMPLTVQLRVEAADTSAVALALSALSLPCGALQPEPTPEGLQLRCPRSAKMQLLQALAPFGARVLDVHITEPSLEDVFFDLAR
ncbi:ABC transporter ATP-binding protein [Caldimonas brevitalea]|uniref:Copper ABC transporter ATP-binding protein n=1 Tax=Caldimonas brevitalea TaxID=413882 RepID=A0A0G3BMY9_9BURK|nr:ABC transporter ATP-binding protein [Caldimonas brevitalea]AKJ30804.1 copper ABC transporter ATP-binding protein [Caldimonas brevitalea]